MVRAATVREQSAFSHENRFLTGAALIGTLGLLTGCGKPQGTLFPEIKPAVVWPSTPELPRIRLVGMISGSRDLHAAVSGAEVFKAVLRGPRPPINLSSPNMVALGPGRLIAVSDGSGGAVHLIDLDQRTHRTCSGWSDDERFDVPIGVAWVGNRLFVSDAGRHEIIELDDFGGYRGRFGSEELSRPVGIAYVSEKRRLYVVDGAAHDLVVFDLDGTFERRIGRRGSAPGTFNFPSHIACRDDRLLVADSGNFRVQMLDLEGACLKIIGQKGDGAGDFSLPKGVAFNSDGHIYVADSHFENVQIFDEEGRLLLAIGEEGTAAGSFSLPAGIAIDENDRIWVADAGNRRLQVFDYLRNEE